MNQETIPNGSAQLPDEEKLQKKTNNRILWILLGTVTLLLLAAGIILFCLTRPTPVSGIEFAAAELVLKEGQSAVPAYTIFPGDAAPEDLQWKTTNRSVATVSKGMITAHFEGSCMISVTSASGAKDTLTVKVEAPIVEAEAPVIGQWLLFAVAEEENIRYYYSIEASLVVRENRTGAFSFEGQEYEIEDWRYSGQEKTYTVYNWVADDLQSGFYYCRDGTSPYDRCLILPLSDGRTLIFHKEAE